MAKQGNDLNEEDYGNNMKDDFIECSAYRDATWQDISGMVDYISLIVTAVVNMIGFVTFLIVTRVSSI